MYAIRHKKKQKWLYNIRHDLIETNPDRFKLDKHKALTFINNLDAKCFMVMNHMSKNVYDIVKINIVEDKEND